MRMRMLIAKTVLLAGAFGASLASAQQAQQPAAATASWTQSGNAVLMSDYVFRGVT